MRWTNQRLSSEATRWTAEFLGGYCESPAPDSDSRLFKPR